MKHIYLNLKRFDVPLKLGGVNRIAGLKDWGPYIIRETQDRLKAYDGGEAEFTMFFPEMHLIGAIGARKDGSPVQIGCQGVSRSDVRPGGNFGAFTTGRPAAAMAAAGCQAAIVGHCEERGFLAEVLGEAGVQDPEAVDRLLAREVRAAVERGMRVLYCIGEKTEELDRWQEVLGRQLSIGLEGVDKSMVTIAYEPVWSIGPGKTPAGKEHITMIARFVKEETGGMDIVYGGGLKQENAKMLASIKEIDGGLIALTRFSGEIGFYPEEYIEIIRIYLDAAAQNGGKDETGI